MPATMSPLKAILLVTSVVASLADAGEDVYENDSFSLLQAQFEEKSAAVSKGKIEDLDETASDYNLPNDLACAEAEKPAAFIEPMTPTATLKEVINSVRLTPETESGDPPGAGMLRAVLELMIIAIICDGIRRFRLQKQDMAGKQKSVKSTPAHNEAEAAEEAAWVAMVNAASAANEVNFEKSLVSNPPVARTDTWGCSPLHFAAAGGSTSIAAELLKRGAEVDGRDASEETPLHFAARAGHAPICALLLGAGAKIDAVNVQDMTPFIIAGHANQEPVCRLLADSGAGVAGMSDEQLPPLVVSQLVRKMFGA